MWICRGDISEIMSFDNDLRNMKDFTYIELWKQEVQRIDRDIENTGIYDYINENKSKERLASKIDFTLYTTLNLSAFTSPFDSDTKIMRFAFEDTPGDYAITHFNRVQLGTHINTLWSSLFQIINQGMKQQGISQAIFTDENALIKIEQQLKKDRKYYDKITNYTVFVYNLFADLNLKTNPEAIISDFNGNKILSLKIDTLDSFLINLSQRTFSLYNQLRCDAISCNMSFKPQAK
jgi:hypothetical protein